MGSVALVITRPGPGGSKVEGEEKMPAGLVFFDKNEKVIWSAPQELLAINDVVGHDMHLGHRNRFNLFRRPRALAGGPWGGNWREAGQWEVRVR